MNETTDWIEPYYIIVNTVKSNIEVSNKKIIIHTKLNRSSFKDAERRMRSVLFKILKFSKNDYYSNVCVGLKCDIETKDLIIITDDLKYSEYLKKEKFQRYNLIKKENNLTLNNDVHLIVK